MCHIQCATSTWLVDRVSEGLFLHGFDVSIFGRGHYIRPDSFSRGTSVVRRWSEPGFSLAIAVLIVTHVAIVSCSTHTFPSMAAGLPLVLHMVLHVVGGWGCGDGGGAPLDLGLVFFALLVRVRVSLRASVRTKL